MEADLYDYTFDPALIAQRPVADRSSSRLLLLDRQLPGVRHQQFAELPELIRGDELFVVNDTRVIPARLLGRKESGGRVELLLVDPVGGGGGQQWRAMGRANKPLRVGQRLRFGEETVEVLASGEEGLLEVRFREGLDLLAFLEQQGQIPLPPYIERAPVDEDRTRYQTIFADRPGAVAAPTAGLHFTPELRVALEARGASFATLTLHVGPGTFRPIVSATLDEHRMHRERYEIPEATGRAVLEARQAGRPVVAVGTTVVRTLEAAALEAPAGAVLRTGPGQTELFIRPGFPWRVVDGLITNFHWPRSTLLVLVSALAGRERILAAYREAVAEGYRLFSYGDAMWIR